MKKTKSIICNLLLVLTAIVASAQPVPPTTAFTRYLLSSTNQSQFQSRAGIDTNGVGVTYNLDNSTNLSYTGLSASARTSVTNAATGAALNATNKLDTDLRADLPGVIATNPAAPIGAVDPLHINIRSAHKTMAKLRSRQPLKVVNFGDDQIVPTTGIIAGFTNLVTNRRGPVIHDGSYLYRTTVGTASESSSSAAAALGLLPLPTIRMANASSFTNTSSLVNGFATTLIPVNYYSSNGFGSFTIYTNAFGAAPVALATVSANNGGALAYSYTNFVVSLVTNLIVGVASSGTNIIIGAGQTDTNLSTWCLDNWEAGNVKLADFTASTTISNMARSFWASNDFDFVVIHDINGTDGTTASNEWYTAQRQFEVALTNSGVVADIFYFTPTPITNVASSAVGVAQRLGMIVACREFNRGMFDSYRMALPYNVANSLAYYQVDGLHLNSVASDYLVAQFFDEIGLTPDVLRIYGTTAASSLQTNATEYAAWNLQALSDGNGKLSISNYWSSGRVGLSFSGSGLVGEYNVAGSQALTAIRGTNGTYLVGVNKGDGFGGEFGRFSGQGGLILYPSGGGSINNFEPGAGGISISGGFTNYGTGNTSHIKGGARIDGTLATAQITTTNFIALFTNYTAANFAPVAGQIKLVASNSIIYAVSQVSTNPLW